MIKPKAYPKHILIVPPAYAKDFGTDKLNALISDYAKVYGLTVDVNFVNNEDK